MRIFKRLNSLLLVGRTRRRGKYKMNGKGITLLELLIVAGIMVLITTAALGLLVAAKNSADQNETQIQVKEYAQRAMDKVSKELRLSRPSFVRITNSIGWSIETTGTVDGVVKSKGSVVNFQMPVGIYTTDLNLDINYNLRWGCQDTVGHYLAYSLDANSNLIRTDYANVNGSGTISQTTIAPYVSSISFVRDNSSAGYITITITAGKAGPRKNQIISQTLISNVRLKN